MIMMISIHLSPCSSHSNGVFETFVRFRNDLACAHINMFLKYIEERWKGRKCTLCPVCTERGQETELLVERVVVNEQEWCIIFNKKGCFLNAQQLPFYS